MNTKYKCVMLFLMVMMTLAGCKQESMNATNMWVIQTEEFGNLCCYTVRYKTPRGEYYFTETFIDSCHKFQVNDGVIIIKQP